MGEAKSQHFQFTGTVNGRYNSKFLAGSTIPSVPVLTVTSVSQGISVNLSQYDPATTTFTLQRATNSGFTSGLTTISSSMTAANFPYSDSSLAAGTYYYRVSATGEGGTSSYSSTVTTSPIYVPSVTASRINATTVQFTFTGGSGATSWTGYYRTPAGTGSYTPVSLDVGQAYYDVTVADSSTANFYVAATNAAGTANSSVVTGSAASGVSSTPTLVVSTFESSDFAVTNGQFGQINNIGYSYPETNYTSIVGMNSGVATRYNPLPITTYPGHDYTPHDGTRCLRFNYIGGAGNMAEQRFAFGTPQRDIWFRYWVRVPTNFDHSPLGNHKFFALWMDAYEGSSPLIIWEFWPSGSGSTIGYHFRPTGGSSGAHLDQKSFISVPADRGRWMQIVIHAKAATNGSSNDGVIQMWRRWDGESSFTQLHNKTDANFAVVTNNGWRYGYFMGWANSNNYTVDTQWLIDNVEISDASLI